MQLHEINIDTSVTPAQVTIDEINSALSITAGQWPLLVWKNNQLERVLANVPGVNNVGLQHARFIYISWPNADGVVTIDLSDTFISYGHAGVSPTQNVEADMLAWYDSTEWHVKKLVAAQPETLESPPEPDPEPVPEEDANA